MSVQLELIFRLPIAIKKDQVGYVSHCPPLDVWSQGDTKAEARKNIREAVSLFVVSCIERGTLDEVMKECGFQPTQTKKSGKMRSSNNIDVSIPFNVTHSAGADLCPA